MDDIGIGSRRRTGVTCTGPDRRTRLVYALSPGSAVATGHTRIRIWVERPEAIESDIECRDERVRHVAVPRMCRTPQRCVLVEHPLRVLLVRTEVGGETPVVVGDDVGVRVERH